MEDATLLSVNGQLQSSYKAAPPIDARRSTDYNPVDIGRPLIVRYMRFFLKHGNRSTPQTIMLSNFAKTSEAKPGESEAITYFNDDARFKSGEFAVSDFGGALYGHPLIYYTKSYLGQSIKLTTRYFDINNSTAAKSIADTLKSAVEQAGKLPVLGGLLPYVGLVKGGIDLFKSILDFFTTDQAIADDHEADLYFDEPDQRQLQSGRYVCIPGASDRDFEEKGFRLADGNVLLKPDGTEYRDSTYFVFRVDSRRVDHYEGFDYFAKAAEFMARTNRTAPSAQRVVSELSALMRGALDAEAVLEIQKLAPNAGDAAVRQKIEALFNGLSPEMQAAFKPLYDAIIKAP